MSKACCGHKIEPIECNGYDDPDDEDCDERAWLRCRRCKQFLCPHHVTNGECLADGDPHEPEVPICEKCPEQARRACTNCGAAVCMRHTVRDL